MNNEQLTALASYCNNPNCQWASLNDDANQIAGNLFKNWQASNNWNQPWDGFLEICNANGYPSATRLIKLHVGDVKAGILQRFDYYGSTWAIFE